MYIVKYVKTPHNNLYYVVLSDNSTLHCSVDQDVHGYYLSMHDYDNSYLFDKFQIGKNALFEKLFTVIHKVTEFGFIVKLNRMLLLKVLIKESQKNAINNEI